MPRAIAQARFVSMKFGLNNDRSKFRDRSAQQKCETVVIETFAEWMGLSFVCLYSLINSFKPGTTTMTPRSIGGQNLNFYWEVSS